MNPTVDQSSLVMTASDDELRDALEAANIPTLLLVLAQFEGEKWLREPYLPSRTVATNDNDTAGFSPELQQHVRHEALRVLTAWRDGDLQTPAPPAAEDIPRRLSVALGEPVPTEYALSMAEEAGFTGREEVGWTQERPAAAERFQVVIIGAGLSGVAAAVTMERLGLPYTVIEKSSAAGGVWNDNGYPGAGVDTPVHLYSYSFAPRRDWTRYYARQQEIRDYIRTTADDFGVTPHVQFETEVVSATWDEADAVWKVEIRRGETTSILVANAIVSCVGVLNRPSVPSFPGADTFDGPLFHSARWPEGLDVSGRTVAVVGTGATSMQLVPAIAGTAKKVVVIQRSPQWVAPNANYLREVSPEVRLLMNQVPYYAAFYRIRLIWMFQDKLLASLRRDPEWPHPERSINATNEKHREFFTQYIDKQLGDRTDLRDKVLPTYPPYGKRILMDNRWIETVKRDDVELVQAGVAGFDEHHVLTDDGQNHPADVVVLATGFESSRMLQPMQVRGRSGADLHEVWGDDNPFAYLGMTVPGFPNFFVIGGPNTALGHGGSAIYPAECCIAYVAQLLVRMVEDDLSAVEVQQEVCQDYNDRVDAEHAQLIWTHPGMTVWYKNAQGRVTATAPWRGVDFWEMTRTPNFDDFVVTHKDEVTA